ncbi:MAG: Trk family potassium uptake protein, partial [Lachnospiraceae bacterium]|nr:Trk family potassium uptake protein [Lachnospiraceae bacterium]
MSAFQVIILGFLALILVGTGLLMLPFATKDRAGASFADALFTATSATCVTGLIVRDTATYWSVFGKVVLIILIQIGGLGVITVSLLFAMLLKKKIGLGQRSMMQESISASQVGGIVRMTSFIVKTVAVVEVLGAALLSPAFIREFGV